MKDDVKDALDKLVKKILAYNPKDKGKSKKPVKGKSKHPNIASSSDIG